MVWRRERKGGVVKGEEGGRRWKMGERVRRAGGKKEPSLHNTWMTDKHLEGERGRRERKSGRKGGKRREKEDSPNVQKALGPSLPMPTSPSRSCPLTTPG
jgi:hypothetical protein